MRFDGAITGLSRPNGIQLLQKLLEVQMDWQILARNMHQISMALRAESPYSKDNMPFVMQEYHTEDKCDHYHLFGGLNDNGRLFLRRKAAEMAHTGPVAVIFSADSRFLLPEKFNEHFGLDQNMPFEEWDARRQDIINDHGGSMGNLPKHTWQNAIVTGVKGPLVQQLTLHSPYTCDATDKVVYGELTESSQGTWYVIPNWWNSTAQ